MKRLLLVNGAAWLPLLLACGEEQTSTSSIGRSSSVVAGLSQSESAVGVGQDQERNELNLLATIEILLDSDRSAIQEALEQLKANWQPNYTTALVEFLRASFRIQQPGFRTTAFAVIDLLEERHSVDHGGDLSAWFQLIWKADDQPHPQSAAIKSLVYGGIDPKFKAYFSGEHAASVRLNEVRWGGVLQDGIPPLRNPAMLAAEEATYLEDDHVVFGIEVNGDVRAYPKRILAWHEMFTDKVGGLEVTGVY